MKWSGKDDINPDDARQTVMKVAHILEVAKLLELWRKSWIAENMARDLDRTGNRQDKKDSKSGSGGRKHGGAGKGEKTPRI